LTNYWKKYSIIIMDEYSISPNKLLEMHIETLFTLNSQMRLVSINEPWDKTKAAPQLYIGKAADGSVIYKFRYDIPLEKINKLEAYLAKETSLDKDNEIKYVNEYLRILEKENYSNEICYYYNSTAGETGNNCIQITAKNIKDYTLGSFGWLNDEIKYSQPCYGVIENSQIVSICRSVRITEKAHEAGIETLEEYRGKGFAKIVLKGWIKEIQSKGIIGLYSTNKENKSSQKVAEKALLKRYGVGISIK
jgi:hypothetical protein